MKSRFLLLCVMFILRPHPAKSQILSLLANVFIPLILNPKETIRRRKLQCLFKMVFAMLRAGSLTDPRNIVKMFEEDSVMQLAQAGAYVGPADVGEYMGFVNAETSPYLIASTLDAIAFEIIGYDEESEQCELIFMTKDSYTTNPVTTEREESFSTGLLSRTFLDYKGKFYTRFNIFYTKGFLDLVFADLLAGETTQSFICNDVLNGACSGFLDTTVDCTQALSLLPKAEGDNLYVDGNSLGCRGLHSAFAYTNPEFHCPHVALTETEDPKGRVRCQSSEFLPISDLVSAELIEQFDQFLEENGVDPEIGYALKE